MGLTIAANLFSLQGKFMKKPDKGRKVFCHLDTKVGTLGYSVDSGPVKIAFTGLRGKTLYPWVMPFDHPLT